MTHAVRGFRSHAETVLDLLGRDPGREAVVYGARRVTAGELRDLALRTARALRARGVGPGRTVTLLAGNLPETIAARYAAHLLGCRVVQFHGDAPVRMRAALVRDAETHVLVADPRSAAGAAALAATAGVADLVTLGPAEAGEDLLAAASREPAEPVPSIARPQDVCLIRPTGGTTGPPKGVCVSYAQAGAWRRAAGPAHRLLVCTPIAHGPGRLADRTLAAGGTVVLHDGFEPGEVLAAVERERITRLYLLPPLLHSLLDHPDLGRRDLTSLTSLPYGACRASPARLAEAVRRLGPVLYQIYGQTEAGSISQLDAADHDVRYPERLGSAGRPLPGVEVAIRDEAGRDLPVGGAGEIWVRSDRVMRGYWKQPALTAEVLRGGWLRTGDLGRLDRDGYLTVVDRLKDMVPVTGAHVYTTEVEDVLDSCPGVRQSAVYGALDADGTERVHAVVVPEPGRVAVDEGPLREAVRRTLGATHVPARITFATALPLTGAGKPDKKLLRRRAEERGRAEESGT
ncbi:AMP-binding protein [Streptomyces sp. CBMA156]|uniref:AMP-binding protein n=1 Tax=Streptomyces sp. CBMA156 TaxID=1930280 RepID=UPI00166207CD|nr:AMP-binding protein [Streptomyces sp. CBMA156]MBD0673111.1 fatty acid--CoA ligase [Streptomyces sp. CBMA156]